MRVCIFIVCGRCDDTSIDFGLNKNNLVEPSSLISFSSLFCADEEWNKNSVHSSNAATRS